MARPATMMAMVLEKIGEPLRCRDLPVPRPGSGEVLLSVAACGVCRTDLHLVDGELPHPLLPVIPGHEIVGRVVATGADVSSLAPGDRVGVPWLGSTCGRCRFCLSGRENLCDTPAFTGYTRQGGYAGFTVADARYCFRLPERMSDEHAAPLLCAGLIGYRSYRMIGEDAVTLGIYGFGAAAHIIAQVAVHQHKRVFAFTRRGDHESQALALRIGAEWAGASDEAPPEKLDAAIVFAPVGSLVPAALAAVDKGGTVVCGGIHMSDVPTFPYRLLWEERVVRSVANLTRRDGEELLELAAATGVRTEVRPYPLDRANEALEDLRAGRFAGAAVLTMA